MAVFEDFLAFSSSRFSFSHLEQRPKSQYLTDSGNLFRVCVLGAPDSTKVTLAKKYAGMRLHPTAYEQVGKVHAKQRIEAVRDYLSFLYDKLGDHLTRDEAVDDVKRRSNRKICRSHAVRAEKKTRIDEEIEGARA